MTVTDTYGQPLKVPWQTLAEAERERADLLERLDKLGERHARLVLRVFWLEHAAKKGAE